MAGSRSLVFEALTPASYGDHELPLTYFSIGMWKRRDRLAASIILLVLNTAKKFVFLVETRLGNQAGSTRRLQKVLRQISASTRSPFNSSNRQSHYVVAFEVEWKDVVGLDYLNRLCEDGRVALEAQQTVKREFQTMGDAKSFYLPAKTPSNPNSPELLSPKPGPRARSAEGAASQPNLPALDLVAEQDLMVRSLSENLDQLHASRSLAARQDEDTHSLSLEASGLCSAVKRSLDLGTVSKPRSAPCPPHGSSSSMVLARCRMPKPDCHQAVRMDAAHSQQHCRNAADSELHAVSAVCRGELPASAATLLASQPIDMPPPTCAADLRAPADKEGRAHSLPEAMTCAEPWAGTPGTAQLSRGPSSLPDASTQQPIDSLPSPAGQAVPQQAGRNHRWPPPSAWTLPSHTFECRTIIFQFSDPYVPGVLRAAVQSNERLLKLYESGLPAWAIFMPAYGLWYRPWMRRVTYLLFIAISIFSMACGFYDLYKNVPYLDKVMRRLIGSMYLPSSAIFAWLENHAQIRLSILLTYLFGKSMLFMQLLKWLGHFVTTCRAALQPVLDVLGPPLASLALLVQAGGRQVLDVGMTVSAACLMVGRFLFGPPARLLWMMLQLVAQVLLPVYQVLKAVVMGPMALVIAFFQYLGSGAQAMCTGLRVMSVAVTSTAKAVKASAKLAPAVQSSVQEVAWWRVVPADAFELVRVSLMKSLRAIQAVMRFLIQICCDTYKHRLTLGIRMARNWDAVKHRAASNTQAVQAWLHALMLQGSQRMWHAGMGRHAENAAGPPSPSAERSDIPEAGQVLDEASHAQDVLQRMGSMPAAATAHAATISPVSAGHRKWE